MFKQYSYNNLIFFFLSLSLLIVVNNNRGLLKLDIGDNCWHGKRTIYRGHSLPGDSLWRFKLEREL